MTKGLIGTVYLIHFSEPYKHARHYLGFTTDLEKRIRQHKEIRINNLDKESHERGAVLMAYVNSAGIEWEVIRIWEGVPLEKELRMKRSMHFPRVCPKCGVEERRKARERHRRRKEAKRDESNANRLHDYEG